MSNTNYDLRNSAALQGATRYMPPGPCKRGHMSERYTSTGGCVACQQMKVVKRQAPARGSWQPSPLMVPSEFGPEHLAALQSHVQLYVNTTCVAWGFATPWTADPALVAGKVPHGFA